MITLNAQHGNLLLRYKQQLERSKEIENLALKMTISDDLELHRHNDS